ncbi:hypothetical protein AMAG_01505 [Allomyces macrogynus ATCC 38327]|uniref:Uncharacterized protein n=1 Tax=Allomyces macrogynus (strain ATCC 38327) TaxID=578462 RepID=A0A0L0RZU8_ALLM3|nr:hypothetical protein AMAG_01505 [Allomyces macrogynus ATCC 38327]|eukprot:KNE55616.1 hypothetical protein AMAG_01505 [Allomyces macrogynus ATCC 38327]
MTLGVWPRRSCLRSSPRSHGTRSRSSRCTSQPWTCPRSRPPSSRLSPHQCAWSDCTRPRAPGRSRRSTRSSPRSRKSARTCTRSSSPSGTRRTTLMPNCRRLRATQSRCCAVCADSTVSRCAVRSCTPTRRAAPYWTRSQPRCQTCAHSIWRGTRCSMRAPWTRSNPCSIRRGSSVWM